MPFYAMYSRHIAYSDPRSSAPFLPNSPHAQDHGSKLTPGERMLYDLDITMVVTRAHRNIATMTRERDRKREWLHTIPPGKAYAPAYYAYLCRSFPDYARPDPHNRLPLTDLSLAEKAMDTLASVVELDEKIYILSTKVEKCEAMLRDSQGFIHEENLILIESLKGYKGAPEPLVKPSPKGDEPHNRDQKLVLRKGGGETSQDFLDTGPFPNMGWMEFLKASII